MRDKKTTVTLEEVSCYKINKIIKMFTQETEEDLSREDCVKLSTESLYEEMENQGIGRMFLRTQLWKKGAAYFSLGDGIIESRSP